LIGAPRIGVELPLGTIVLVARSIGGHRVNVVGLRLPEDGEPKPQTRKVLLRKKISGVWKSLSGS
jgi:cell volume regulation protein A